MTALANTDPVELVTRERLDDGLGISNAQGRLLLDRIDELQRQLDLAPSQDYVDSLEADLDTAQNEATEAREALEGHKRRAKAMLEALDDEGGS